MKKLVSIFACFLLIVSVFSFVSLNRANFAYDVGGEPHIMLLSQVVSLLAVEAGLDPTRVGQDVAFYDIGPGPGPDAIVKA